MGKSNITTMPIISFVNYSEIVNWSVRYLLKNSFGYNKKYNLFRISGFLQRNRNVITVKDNVIYSRVTIKLYNKGVQKRDSIKGQYIGTKKQYLVKPEQFIISKIDARNGAFGIIPECLDGAITTSDFLSYDIDEKKINPTFLNLLTSTKEFLAYCQGASSGTTGRQRIDENSFLNVKIPIPSLETQNRIVQVYNKRIQLAEKQELQAKQLEQDIESYVFDVLGIEKLEEKKSKKRLKFVRSKDVERWAVDFLSKIAKISKVLTGKYEVIKLKELIISYQYGSSEKASIEKIGTPMLRMNNIFNSEIIVDNLKYINIDEPSKNKYRLNIGDLLFNRTNSKELVGKTAIFNEEGEYTFASYLIRVVINSKKGNLNYINYLFNSTLLKYQKDMTSRQITGQANINAQEMQDFLFPLPPLKIQTEIANTIEKMKVKTKTLQQQAEENRKKSVDEFEKEIFQ